MNWRIQFVFFINVSWLTSVCKWGTLICLPCSQVILYFFPWLKRTFLMWHPPSAHINTHMLGNLRMAYKGEHIHTQAKTCTQTQPCNDRLQFNARMSSKKDRVSLLQLTQHDQMPHHRNNNHTSFYFDIILTVTVMSLMQNSNIMHRRQHVLCF